MFKKWFFCIVCLIPAPALFCLETAQLEKAFLFNMPSLLLEIEAFGGGAGFKAGSGSWYIRGMLDFLAEKDGIPPDMFVFALKAAYEKHPLRGKASPYIGLTSGVDFSSSLTNIAGGDWSKEEYLGLEMGPLLGIELEVMDHLSLFAEYQLLGRLERPSVTTYTGGDTARVNGDLLWSVDLGLGNAGMLGICVYLD